MDENWLASEVNLNRAVQFKHEPGAPVFSAAEFETCADYPVQARKVIAGFRVHDVSQGVVARSFDLDGPHWGPRVSWAAARRER